MDYILYLKERCMKYNPRIIIVDFINILLSFYYQFIDTLTKFIITQHFDDSINVTELYNIILINFLKYSFIYFIRTRTQFNNYSIFVKEYISYLINNTQYSDKTIKFIENFLLQNRIMPIKNTKEFNIEYIKLINFMILFIFLKLYFIDFNENIQNFTEIILILNIRDDYSTKKNNENFLGFIKDLQKNKIFQHISTFISKEFNIPINIIIKYIKRIDDTSIKTEIDDLHCIKTYIDIYNNPCTNVILFSNDKYRQVLSKQFNFSHETLVISNLTKKIIHNKYSINDTYNILKYIKKLNFLDKYSLQNIKYKDYKFGTLNPLVLDKYKLIIKYLFIYLKTYF